MCALGYNGGIKRRKVMNLEEKLEKLWIDYLDLCESHQSDLPVHEFGFAMIRHVAHTLFDCAPNELVARETIRVGIEEGYKDSKGRT